ncbi:cation efflux family superfamily protein [Pelomyxa schiedti]|nr:cation efflux family superfamily protein [Pelomyxa schiedti]
MATDADKVRNYDKLPVSSSSSKLFPSSSSSTATFPKKGVYSPVTATSQAPEIPCENPFTVDRRSSMAKSQFSSSSTSMSDSELESESAFDTKSASLWFVGTATLLYSATELGFAVYTASLTLLSDGFHNLSDVVSIFVAHWARRASKRDQTLSMSYGWARSEVLGGLTNACFLLALSMYVSLEAIPRFFEASLVSSASPQSRTTSIAFIVVAGIGLVQNFVGTVIFAAVGLSHLSEMLYGGDAHVKVHVHRRKHSHEHSGRKDSIVVLPLTTEHTRVGPVNKSTTMDINMLAILVHYAGDAVSSLFIVLIGVLMLSFEKAAWVRYVDPIASLLIVAFILITTFPVVKRCTTILLQGAPSGIQLDAIKKQIGEIAGVVNVHDLHVWQLVDGMIIASVHVVCDEKSNVNYTILQVKEVLHKHNVHSATVQPEMIQRTSSYGDDFYCNQNCIGNCAEAWCCGQPAEKQRRKSVVPQKILQQP